MLSGLECTKCKCKIDDYSTMVQILEDAGYTATYCENCGEEVKKRMKERDDSIQ